jgi:DNA repair protein RadC
VIDVGQMTAEASLAMQAGPTAGVAGPPRLIRETAVPMAQCPSCGQRMALGAEGATWTIHAPSDVADRLIPQLGSLEREELVVLWLNTRNVVLGQTTVYKGNVSASLVRVGELFTEAVRRGVPRIILVHNHPSGNPTPSPDDLNLTASAIAAGRLLDIEVLDHIVIGGGSYVSLRDRGTAFDSSVPGRHANSEESR